MYRQPGKRSTTMRKTILALAAIVSLAVSPTLYAQRGGGGGMQGQRPTATGQQRSGQRGEMGRQTGTRDQERQRIHATDQQRDQYRTCTQSADRVRTQACDMAQAAKGGVNNEKFRQQHAQLRSEVQTMQQEHDRFMQGLSEEQRAALHDRIRKMDRVRDRVNTRLQEMDQELSQANPDTKRVARRAREVEKATNEWQKQYRNLGTDMGIEQ
jgi:DNA repair exonuclease SbcCD ATPase subunit